MKAAIRPDKPAEGSAGLAEAQALVAAGDRPAAERLYRKLIAADASLAPALHGLGALCFEAGRRDEAISLLERAVRAAPGDPALLAALANGYAAVGRFVDAERECRAALAQAPDLAALHFLLGRLLRDQGRAAAARSAFARALALEPTHAAAAYALARLLESGTDRPAAIAAFRRAATLAPERADAQYRLGRLLNGTDDAGAAAAFAAALRLRPDYAEAASDLGALRQREGRLADAIGLYRRALAANPALVEAAVNLSGALLAEGDTGAAKEAAAALLPARPDYAPLRMALGRAELALENHKVALAHFEAALAADPADHEAMFQAGSLAIRAGDPRRAAAQLETLLAHRPDSSEAWNNYGSALAELERFEAAEQAIRKAIALDPQRRYFSNLAILLSDQGRDEAALLAQRQGVAAAPEDADAHLNHAIHLLRLGKLREGWQEYEWRWKTARFQRYRRRRVSPGWAGEPLAGKTILLQWEQGLGDTIQFARYGALLAREGARVVAEVQPALARLLNGAPFLAAAVPTDGPIGRIDCQASLMSLPHLCAAREPGIPAAVPYLRAEPAAQAAWRKRLAALPRPWIGLAWQGSTLHRSDAQRSIPLKLLMPALADAAGLVSLQKGHGSEQIAAEGLEPRIRDWTEEFVDFADSAALVASLDLVICVDTAVGHLAGALGKPAWLLLPFTNDFRWLAGRTDSPWYPHHRLFRQRRKDRWEEPLAELDAAFARYRREFRDEERLS
jgi:tetratricopeptide (TPR) repeat protein